MAADIDAAASPYGNRDMSAPVELDRAYRLPGIFAIDPKVTQQEGTLEGTFTAWNNEEAVMGGLQYTMQVWKEHLLYAETAMREPFSLNAKEERTMRFSYALPSLPAGTYTFRIQMVTNDGRALGWADHPLKLERGTSSFVELTPLSLSLPEFSGQNLEPLSGPNVSAKSSFTLEASVKNLGSAPLTLTPFLEVYRFDIATGNPETLRSQAVTLQAGEQRQLSFPVQAASSAGVYAGLLHLANAQGKILSSLGEYRWVVRGASADVFPLRISQLGQKAGEQTIMKLDFVGAPDAETVSKASIQVEMTDANGIVASAALNDLELTDAITESNVRLQLTRDLVGAPTIRTIIRNDQGIVLKETKTAIALSLDSIAPPASSAASNIISILLMVILATAIMAGCIYILSRSRNPLLQRAA